MIRVAIVGTGVIAGAHLDAYTAFAERCQIVAMSDIYEEKAEQRKKQYQLSCDIVSDYHDLLERDDIDVVSVCTPPFTHADIAVDFLNAGKHVLVEKPMASSLIECDRMNEAMEKSGKILSIISQNRFYDPVMRLKQLLSKDLIGKVLHAQVDSFWWRGYSYYDLWWRGTWEKEGGGPTLNHAVHHIDMFHWLMGMPNQVQAVMSNTAHHNAEVEDLSIALFKYDDGALAQITSSVVHHGEEQQIILQGERARISTPWKAYASTSKQNGFPERNTELEQKLQSFYESVEDLKYTGHKGQIDNVLNAVETGGKVLIDGYAGRNTLELITAIYQAATEGKAVTLPLQADSPFYTKEGIMANAPRFYEKKNSVENFDRNEITLGRSAEEEK